MSVPPRALLPAALVLILAWAGGTMPRADPCASTDGPQYKCWLDRQEGTR